MSTFTYVAGTVRPAVRRPIGDASAASASDTLTFKTTEAASEIRVLYLSHAPVLSAKGRAQRRTTMA
jgi:hypothetical protein